MSQPKENSPIKRDILFRVHLLYAAFILIAALVFARLIWVQLFSSEVAYNAERLAGRIFSDEILPARRGNILARNGEPLATSLFRYQVEMDYGSEGFDSLRTFREQSDSLAKLLALYFKDKPASAYARMMQREHDRRYRVTYRKDTLVPRSEGRIARWFDRLRGEEFRTEKLYDTVRDHTPVPLFPREVDYNEWQTLRRYPILNWNMGMTYHLRERDERIYPQGELARRTIGKVGDQGNYGVEHVFRDTLEGRPGKARRQRIARGFSGRVVGGGNMEPENGLDVVTTLDVEMQDVADRALRRQLEREHALWGTALVMEVETGDLLAMANLSRTASGGYAETTNRALSARMEPGSTFKLAALLALVDDAGMDLDETFDTGNGARVKVGRTTVQDSHGLPPLNLKDAVAHSSNVFFARAVYESYKDHPERYVQYLRHLHLDRTVGLEEFGSVAPVFPMPGMKIWYPDVTLVYMGYGYAIELTPLHTLTLYNAVANDGCMVAPRLIREIRRGDEVVARNEPRVLVDRICSASSLRKVRECLEEVGTTGTAQRFFRDTTLFKIAGKTGTAQYAQGGIKYSDGYYLGTMVLYFPADKPKYTVLTAMFTRRGLGTTYYGAGLSGPVEQQIVNYIYNRQQEWYGRVGEADEAQFARTVKGGDIAQIRESAGELMPRVQSDRRSGWGHAAVDSTGRVTVTALDEDLTSMPDVRGMGLKEALFLLESRGLRVAFTGKGAVCGQSLPPGRTIRRGETVSLRLK